MSGFVTIIGVIGAILIVLVAQKRSPHLRGIAIGLLISYITSVFILGSAEFYMRCCYIESDNLPTLAQQNWWERYVNTNSLGFRDREWTAADLADKTVVVVVGDSFTAGNGINDDADRVSNILGKHLGDEYAVLNLGISGTATPEQLQTLKDFTLAKPDVVIWQYFLNDINHTGLRLGISPQIPELPQIAKDSYLANFLYWRFFPPTEVVATDGTIWQNWWEWTYAAYDNFGIWEEHRKELYEMVDYADSINAELIVLIYPDLTQIMRTIPYVDRVAQALEAHDVTNVVKLFDAAAAWDKSDLTVSRRDTHPSVSFNHYVGDLLYEQFFEKSS
jgi:lysophospholipase L1-like esterase